VHLSKPQLFNPFNFYYNIMAILIFNVGFTLSSGKLTKEYLYKLCSTSDGMYAIPRLNDILYLHQKGIVYICKTQFMN